MKFRALLISLILCCGAAAYGQDTVTVSGTIVDSDSLTWINGTWSATLVNPYPSTNPTYIDTGGMVQAYYSGTLSSGGVISATIPNNSAILPVNTQWAFTFCPKATSPCTTLTPVSITSNYNISSAALAQIKPPRFSALGTGVYGYGDVEVIPTPIIGGFYYNVTTSTQRIWNGTAFVNGAGSGTGTITGVTPQTGITGGGTTGTVTVGIDTTVVPTLTGVATPGPGANTFSGNINTFLFNGDHLNVAGAPLTCSVGNNYGGVTLSASCFMNGSTGSSTEWGCAHALACSQAIATQQNIILVTPAGNWPEDVVAVQPNSSTSGTFNTPSVGYEGAGSGTDVFDLTTSRVYLTTAQPYLTYKAFGPNMTVPVEHMYFDGNNLAYISTLYWANFCCTIFNDFTVSGGIGTGFSSGQAIFDAGGTGGTTDFQMLINNMTINVDGALQQSQLPTINLQQSGGNITPIVSASNSVAPKNAYSATATNSPYPLCSAGYKCLPLNLIASVPSAGMVPCSTMGTIYVLFNATTGIAPTGSSGIQVLNPVSGCPAGLSYALYDNPPSQYGLYAYHFSDSKVVGLLTNNQGSPQQSTLTITNCTINSSTSFTLDYTVSGSNLGTNIYPYVHITGGSTNCAAIPATSYLVTAVNSATEAVFHASGLTPTAGAAATGSITQYDVGCAVLNSGSGSTWDRNHLVYDACGMKTGGGVLIDTHLDTTSDVGLYLYGAPVITNTNFYQNTGVYNTTNFKGYYIPTGGVAAGTTISGTTCSSPAASGYIDFLYNGSDMSLQSAANRDASGVRITGDVPCSGGSSVSIDIFGTTAGVVDILGTVTMPGTVNITGSLSGTNVKANSVSLTASEIQGDNICAHAGDVSVGTVAITGETVSSGSCTYATAGIPVGYNPSQAIQVVGATTTGYNVTNAGITGISGNNVTAPCTATGTGVASYGNMNLYCQNQSTDAIVGTPQTFLNTLTGISFPTSTTRYEVTSGYTYWGATSAPTITLSLYDGANQIYGNAAALSTGSSTSDSPGLMGWDLLGTSVNTYAHADISKWAWNLSNSPSNYSNTIKQPVVVPSASSSLTQKAYFSTTGMATVTSASGGTISGTIGQTCILTMSNGGGTGATATATLTGSSTLTGATFVTTNTGSGYTSAPTTSTATSGTASCSGTPTVVTTVGGAQGNMISVRHFEYHQ